MTGRKCQFCPLHRNGCVGRASSGVNVSFLPALVLNSCLPIGNNLMKDSAAIISGLLFELLKTVASAGQVFALSCHLQLCASVCGNTQEGLFGAGSASQALGLSGSDFLTGNQLLGVGGLTLSFSRGWWPFPQRK